MRRKGLENPTGMVIMILVVSVLLVVATWMVSSFINAVNLPTSSYYKFNDSVNFAANNTYYAYGTTFLCRSIVPIPSSCGADNGTTLVVSNATQTLSAAIFTFNVTHIKGVFVCTPGACELGVWNISYRYNDFQNSATGTTYNSIVSTVWSGFSLAIVAIIVIAAVAIIGILLTGFRFGGGV